MKKNLLALVCGIAFIQSVRSQTYNLDPAATVNVIAPYEELTIFDIYQINATDSNIVYGWTRVSVNLPSGWDYSLCDYPNCYTGIPASGQMDSVGGGYMGFLGVNINPYSIAGQGIVKIYVFDTNFPNSGDTLTWIINSSPVSIAENADLSSLKIYPNPATDRITINNGENPAGTSWTIFSLDGKMQMTGTFGQSGTIELGNLPCGMYLLHLDGNKSSGTVKFSVMK